MGSADCLCVAAHGRLYRAARKGEIHSADASRLASIIAVMRQCLESGEVEVRIAELESALEAALADRNNVLPFRARAWWRTWLRCMRLGVKRPSTKSRRLDRVAHAYRYARPWIDIPTTSTLRKLRPAFGLSLPSPPRA